MPSRPRLLLALALWTASAATCFAAQKSSIDKVLDSLFAVRTFKQVAISPDGKKVAWVENLKGPDQEPTGKSAIYVATLGSSERPRRISAGDGSTDYAEHDVAWSPDSRNLAFLSDEHDSHQLQLYTSGITGHAARQVTRLTGFLASPSWSPDGKTLALLFTENAPRAAVPSRDTTRLFRRAQSRQVDCRVARRFLGLSSERLDPGNLFSAGRDCHLFEGMDCKEGVEGLFDRRFLGGGTSCCADQP